MRNRKFKLLIIFAAVILAAAGCIRYSLYNVLFPKKYSDIVEKYAAVYCLDDHFVYSVIKAESNFNADAVSHKGAKGLMQITDSTGRWAAEMIGIEGYEDSMLFDPDTNIKIGCWYLNRLIEQYGNRDTAVAAYNAGSGNVSRWLDQMGSTSNELIKELIPYEETRNHVDKINLYLKIYNMLYK